MFSHNGANGPESKMTHMFHRVHQVVGTGAELMSMIAGVLLLTLKKHFILLIMMLFREIR